MIKYKIAALLDVFYRDENGNLLIMTFWNSLYIAFFLLPLGIQLPTPFFIISIILGCINIFQSEKKIDLDNKALLLFPLYFVVMLISLVYSDHTADGINLITRSLTLLLFPIIFLFVKEDASTVRKLFQFLLFGIVVSFFVNLYSAVYDAIDIAHQVTPFTWSTLTNSCNYFIGNEFSRLINANYLSLYILLVLSYYLKKKLVTKQRTFVVCILFLYLFLLASRAAYLMLFIMSLLLVFKIKDRHQRYTTAIIFILTTIIFVQNPRVFNFYERVKTYDTTKGYDETTSEKSRYLAWDASLRLIRQAPIIGYGVGDANHQLMDTYKELGYTHNYEHTYNAHNQFFQTLLQTGVVGCVILISIFVVLARQMRRSSNEFSVFLILLISLCFESMLVRFNGIVFFSIITPLLLKKRSILSSRIIRNK